MNMISQRKSDESAGEKGKPETRNDTKTANMHPHLITLNFPEEHKKKKKEILFAQMHNSHIILERSCASAYYTSYTMLRLIKNDGKVWLYCTWWHVQKSAPQSFERLAVMMRCGEFPDKSAKFWPEVYWWFFSPFLVVCFVHALIRDSNASYCITAVCDIAFSAKGKKKQFLIKFFCRKFQRIAYRIHILLIWC